MADQDHRPQPDSPQPDTGTVPSYTETAPRHVLTPSVVPDLESSAFEVIPHRVFVGGFPMTTDETQLRQVFEAYGHVSEVKIIRSQQTGVSKGYGFVTFESEAEARKVRMDSTNIELDGRQLNLGPAMRRITPATRYAPPSTWGSPYGPMMPYAVVPAMAPQMPAYAPYASTTPYPQTHGLMYTPSPTPLLDASMANGAATGRDAAATPNRLTTGAQMGGGGAYAWTGGNAPYQGYAPYGQQPAYAYGSYTGGNYPQTYAAHDAYARTQPTTMWSPEVDGGAMYQQQQQGAQAPAYGHTQRQ